MIDFQRLTPDRKPEYDRILNACAPRSCEYGFSNLFCWGVQQVAFLHGCVAFFSHFDGRSVYPYPIGPGDRRAVLKELLEDARQRGIPCRIVAMTAADCRELEQWFPGMFLFRADRDGFDYVYDIQELSCLKGRKFQKKRNHVNRFRQEHPDYRVIPLDETGIPAARELAARWYRSRKATDPQGDYLMESVAINRALRHFEELDMEGILLADGDSVPALALGSRLSPDTFDIQFEKALGDSDGAYAAVNQEFARYLAARYPELRYLNREDDVGSEGLRKAKLSYHPHHMEEKYWAMRADECYPEVKDDDNPESGD